MSHFRYKSHERTSKGIWLKLEEKRWYWPFWTERRYVTLAKWPTDRWRRDDRDKEWLDNNAWLSAFVEQAEAEEANIDEILNENEKHPSSVVYFPNVKDHQFKAAVERRKPADELNRVMRVGRKYRDE